MSAAPAYDAGQASPVASVEDALRTVGATPGEVLEALGDYDGEAYLVGSLAAGFGDRRSDVDVHVVWDGESVETGPILAFTRGGACVDVRHVGRSGIERALASRHPGAVPVSSGRTPAWLLSRWLNAAPFDPAARPLLTERERARARAVIVESLLADLAALAAFAALAERAGAARAWYLVRRAGVAAWELAATLSGRDYLGERWLPARSSHPAVAAVGAAACSARRVGELSALLARIGIDAEDLPRRVELRRHSEAEAWTLDGRPWLLVASRWLVPGFEDGPPTVAAALEGDAASLLHGLSRGALAWSADVEGLRPRLEDAR